jgi:osmoprotectant transport system permease protein
MSFFEYLGNNLDELLELGLEHIVIVAVSVALSSSIGVGVGVLTFRTDRPRKVALAVTSTFLTIPSLALFGIMIAFLGLGSLPTVVALTMYGLLPVLRNTVAGLRGVDPAIVESAKGMGVGDWERLRRIELPLAWPVIMTGMRVSTLLLVGIAAIAAIINGPGLGDPIFDGLGRIGGANALNEILLGVTGVIIVAVLFDLFYVLLYRLTTSRGIR